MVLLLIALTVNCHFRLQHRSLYDRLRHPTAAARAGPPFRPQILLLA